MREAGAPGAHVHKRVRAPLGSHLKKRVRALLGARLKKRVLIPLGAHLIGVYRWAPVDFLEAQYATRHTGCVRPTINGKLILPN
jgi:hypothetical protein